ncbi:MAG: HisA/HisF-related TIM barrel protein [Gemmatimonadaceae bacterium]
MIVIPSLRLADVVTSRDRLDELNWIGFQHIHIALRPGDHAYDRRRALEILLRDVTCAVQISGGFESSDDIEAALSSGAGFVLLGSRAIDEPEWLAGAVGLFPDQLLVQIPARERRVRSRGAFRSAPIDLRELGHELSDVRLGGLVVEFQSDALIEAVDLGVLEDLAESLPFPVQVAGSGMMLATLRDLEFRGVAGTIVDAARLSSTLDEQSLARSFAD